MIKKTTGYADSTGTVHATLKDAQVRELAYILEGSITPSEIAQGLHYNALADVIFSQRNAILDILTTGPRSRPAARKTNGGSKPRKTVQTTELTLNGQS